MTSQIRIINVNIAAGKRKIKAILDIPDEKNGGDRFVFGGRVCYGNTPRLPRLQYDPLHSAAPVNLPRLNT